MTDMTCLADGLVLPADSEKTGINKNEIVVGPTGSGKSYSNGFSRIVHTANSSMVVPITKKEIKVKFKKMFRKRGYKVIDINFADPSKSSVGYDPLAYIHSSEDVIQLARNLVCAGRDEKSKGDIDPYWTDSAVSVLAALILYVLIKAEENGIKASFADVLHLYHSLEVNYGGSLVKTNMDKLFMGLDDEYPGNQATELWKTIMNLSTKTASCIFSTLNTAIDKIFSESVTDIMKRDKMVSFAELGNRRTVLFITTSPMNKTLQNFVNLMYSDMFRELFETAERSREGRLKVPVHILCDDFACGSRINDFEDYISIFRAAGISVTLLLQSESQLNSMYGEMAATTIINNCDTYVYMGGMDIKTCGSISQRMNKPVHKIMSMPLEQVVVFRRGAEPYVGRRYQILDDPVFKKVMQDDTKVRCVNGCSAFTL